MLTPKNTLADRGCSHKEAAVTIRNFEEADALIRERGWTYSIKGAYSAFGSVIVGIERNGVLHQVLGQGYTLVDAVNDALSFTCPGGVLQGQTWKCLRRYNEADECAAHLVDDHRWDNGQALAWLREKVEADAFTQPC